jgi:hypothetical protein
MRSISTICLLLALCLATGCRREPAPAPQTREISLEVLQDKIRGGWAGQMIGVSYGGPTEFRWRSEIIPEEKLPEWKPEMIEGALDQDDIYVDMTFAQVLQEKGLDATTEDFGEMFKKSQYRLWHANLAARRALRRGVPASESGTPKYNIHANDIDFQIESDFVGLMCPGMPQSAIDYAMRAGRVMNYGDGIYGGVFVSCMYAAAFFESDPRRIVEAGLACLPQESPYAKVIADTLRFARENPNDWVRAWQLLEEKWNRRDPCPGGALTPFNIDAKLNGAYIALGLLYGRGDFEQTIKIATRCGQDSDCNPSNAAGILGVVLGYEKIPEIYRSGIPAIADKNFSFTKHSFRTIVESTTQQAVALAERRGGRFLGDRLVIALQQPVPPLLEIWDDYGEPVERIPHTDARFTWKGQWAEHGKATARRASQKGAEVSVSFEGTGFILTGSYLPSGGKADISIDDGPPETIDVYEDQERANESLAHRFKLAPGRHTVRLVVRGEPFEGNPAEKKGRDVVVRDLIVFR